MDKISVLMAIYKERVEWIIDALHSVKIQESHNLFVLELVIILDEPSREKEISNIITSCGFSNKNYFVFLCNEKNIGLARSLNKAFSVSTGNYIARIDADDINYHNRFLTQYNYLKNNADASFVGAGITRMEANGEILNNVYASNNPDMLKIKAFYSSVAYHPTWFMKREVFSTIGNYLPYPNAEDFDFLLRLIENNFRIHNIPEPLVYYRVNSNSLSNKNALRQRKCQLYSLKESKKRKLNINHEFSSKNMEAFIKSYAVTERYHALSQDSYNAAMVFLVEKKMVTALLLLIKSMLLSPWQAYHVLRQAKFKLTCKIKNIY